MRYVGADMAEVLSYAELYRKGIPPVAGGALDQTHWFNEACRLIWHDEAQLKPPPLTL